MVHSFIISDISCHVLYSSLFSFLDDTHDRIELIEKLVQRVKREFDFNIAVSHNNVDNYTENSISDVETKGIFNYKNNNFAKQIVWYSYCGCLYILICDYTDNRILAASTLFFLIRTLKDLLPKLNMSHLEIIQKADVISVIVNSFMPCGQLLFINNQVMQQLIKDIQKAIK